MLTKTFCLSVWMCIGADGPVLPACVRLMFVQCPSVWKRCWAEWSSCGTRVVLLKKKTHSKYHHYKYVLYVPFWCEQFGQKIKQNQSFSSGIQLGLFRYTILCWIKIHHKQTGLRPSAHSQATALVMPYMWITSFRMNLHIPMESFFNCFMNNNKNISCQYAELYIQMRFDSSIGRVKRSFFSVFSL